MGLDSGDFEEMKCLFSIAPKARKGGESLECLSLKTPTGRWIGRGPGWTCASGQFKPQSEMHA
jgi:hypothetical protein